MNTEQQWEEPPFLKAIQPPPWDSGSPPSLCAVETFALELKQEQPDQGKPPPEEGGTRV